MATGAGGLRTPAEKPVWSTGARRIWHAGAICIPARRTVGPKPPRIPMTTCAPRLTNYVGVVGTNSDLSDGAMIGGRAISLAEISDGARRPCSSASGRPAPIFGSAGGTPAARLAAAGHQTICFSASANCDPAAPTTSGSGFARTVHMNSCPDDLATSATRSIFGVRTRAGPVRFLRRLGPFPFVFGKRYSAVIGHPRGGEPVAFAGL